MWKGITLITQFLAHIILIMTLYVEKITWIPQFLAHIAFIMTLYLERNHINYTISSSRRVNDDNVDWKNHINSTISRSYSINYDTVRGNKSY
jgi:hypothetical protein